VSRIKWKGGWSFEGDLGELIGAAANAFTQATQTITQFETEEMHRRMNWRAFERQFEPEPPEEDEDLDLEEEDPSDEDIDIGEEEWVPPNPLQPKADFVGATSVPEELLVPSPDLAPAAAGPTEASTPPFPEPDSQAPAGFTFDQIPFDPQAWDVFVEGIKKWTEGFGCEYKFVKKTNEQEEEIEVPEPIIPQPDRQAIMKDWGVGRWPLYILRWLGKYGSLQRAIVYALQDAGVIDDTVPGEATEEDLDFAEAISANIVQISHAAFPDIAGFYDYSTKWRRRN
jgi:hypothetical protein